MVAGVVNHYDKYTTDPLWLTVWLVCLLAIGGVVSAVMTVRRNRRSSDGPGVLFQRAADQASVQEPRVVSLAKSERRPAVDPSREWRDANPSARRRSARLALRVGGVIVGWLFLWIVIMAFTQEGSCDPALGGLVSTAQHGFARAYCGIDHASSLGVVVDWVLIAILPLCGLALGIAAVTWRRQRPLPLLGTGTATIIGSMLLAWLLAGAH